MGEYAAIIVSNKIGNCQDLIKSKNWCPTVYKCVRNIEQLQGIDPKTPIILTHGYHKLPDDMLEMIDNRFENVKFMDF